MHGSASQPNVPTQHDETNGRNGNTCPLLKVIHPQEENVCPLTPVLDNLPTGVIIADAAGKFTVFNREAQRILGVGAQAVDWTEWSETYGCYLPDRVTQFPAEDLPLARALRGEEVRGELIFVRNSVQRDGTWIRASSKPLRNAAGEPGSGVVVISDVTAQKKAMERIELLSKAVEQTADSVVITDTMGTIKYVNPAFELTTGYTKEEALGNTPRILKSGQHDSGFYRGLWAHILDGNIFRGTLVNRKKSGEMYYAQQTITPIRNDGGKISHFVSVLKDTTDLRKQQEQEIRLRLARQVQQRFYAAAVPRAGIDIGRAAHPAEETGGDYVDFLTLANNRIGVAVGDVSGHGFDSALLMALTRAYVRSYSAQRPELSEIFAGVNRMLLPDLEDDRFVTLLLVQIDLPERMLSYASAGHVPGFVMASSGEVECELPSTGLPLGMFEEYEIESRMVPLKPGSVVALLTDGVTDATNADEHQLSLSGVIKYVREHRAETAQQIADGIYQCARAFAGDQPQQDDITAVILKIS